ncbi:MAG: hypothetical protein KDK36_22455, partial [Leptospiraceae bacterium]|nr:hypothetical protein [Leptospiraceae bacterium]
MNETDRQEKLRKFLHDLSNKLLPVKLKIDIILEDSPSEDMEFIDKNLEGVIDFIKSFNVDTYEFSDEPRKTF